MIKNLKLYDEEIDRIKVNYPESSETLYRGQVDSSWRIQSSLERIGIEDIICEDYYIHIDKLKPLINPLIKNKFTRKITSSGYPFDFDDYIPASGAFQKWSI